MASDPLPNNDSMLCVYVLCLLLMPLAPALEEWLGEKFVKLPEDLQKRVQREDPQFAGLWDALTPHGQRNQARKLDIQHHSWITAPSAQAVWCASRSAAILYG